MQIGAKHGLAGPAGTHRNEIEKSLEDGDGAFQLEGLGDTRVQHSEPGDDIAGPEAQFPGLAGVEPGGRFRDGLQTFRRAAEGGDESERVGLGVESVDVARGARASGAVRWRRNECRPPRAVCSSGARPA